MPQSITENFKRIKEILDQEDQFHEKIIRKVRTSIRLSANTIKNLHRGEIEAAKQFLAENRETLKELRNTISNSYIGSMKNYLIQVEQEYVESLLFLEYLTSEKTHFSNYEELEVTPASYLLGTADLIGELRRHALNCIRNGKNDEANRALTLMEELYFELFSLDYPNVLIPGLRKKIDVARNLIERTRSDLTISLIKTELVNKINVLLKK